MQAAKLYQQNKYRGSYYFTDDLEEMWVSLDMRTPTPVLTQHRNQYDCFNSFNRKDTEGDNHD